MAKKGEEEKNKRKVEKKNVRRRTGSRLCFLARKKKSNMIDQIKKFKYKK